MESLDMGVQGEAGVQGDPGLYSVGDRVSV